MHGVQVFSRPEGEITVRPNIIKKCFTYVLANVQVNLIRAQCVSR